MQTRKLGSISVSSIGIGCNNFGRQLDLEATRAVVHAALDQGITFFDTADSYGHPKTASESLLGESLAPHRDQVVIATKFGRVLDAVRRGAKPAYVRAATEASLVRLRTDRIDLMQLHIPDPDTAIVDTLGALADLRAEGKIREIGCSNFDARELRAAMDAAGQAGLRGFASTQAEYSLLHRAPTADLLAECRASGVRLLPFRPLFNGLLTGKYRPGEAPPTDSRIGSKSDAARSEILSPANLAAVAELTRFAEARGYAILDLAIGWLLAHEEVPSVIAGVSSPAQVAGNAAAASCRLSVDDMAGIAAILAANAVQPTPATEATG